MNSKIRASDVSPSAACAMRRGVGAALPSDLASWIARLSRGEARALEEEFRLPLGALSQRASARVVDADALPRVMEALYELRKGGRPDDAGPMARALASEAFVSALRGRCSHWGAEAEDIVAETAASLWAAGRGSAFCPGKGTEMGYALGAARRIRHRRMRRARRSVPPGSFTPRAGAVEPDPAVGAETNELRSLVREAVKKLAPGDQKLIASRFGVGDSTRTQGPMSSTERASLCRALARLRPTLRRLVDPDGLSHPHAPPGSDPAACCK